MAYGNNNIDPFLGTMTSTTQYRPLLDSIRSAQAKRMAANPAAENAAIGGINDQIGFLSNGLNTAGAIRQPYMDTGARSLGAAENLANPQSAASLASLRADPVLQTIIDQGSLALNKNASANGNRFSGAHALDLMKYAQDATNGYINDLYSRNLNLAQLGSQQAGAQATNQYQYGQDTGAAAANRGEISANAALARGEIGANADLDYGKSLVAQSTVQGLKAGQVAGGNGYGYLNSPPVVQQQDTSRPATIDRSSGYIGGTYSGAPKQTGTNGAGGVGSGIGSSGGSSGGRFSELTPNEANDYASQIGSQGASSTWGGKADPSNGSSYNSNNSGTWASTPNQSEPGAIQGSLGGGPVRGALATLGPLSSAPGKELGGVAADSNDLSLGGFANSIMGGVASGAVAGLVPVTLPDGNKYIRVDNEEAGRKYLGVSGGYYRLKDQ